MNIKLRHLTAGIFIALYGVASHATEFNLNFLQGGASVDASTWEGMNSKYIPGRYLVDVELNGKSKDKRVITITDKDKETLCLSEGWLRGSGIAINSDFYASYFNKVRQCYLLSYEPNTQIEFDFSTQNIKFSLPQKGLKRKTERPQDWDYGMSAIRMNYNANVNVNDVDVSAYSSIGLMANVGHWVATTSVGITEDSVDVPMITATRALYDLKADLTLGKTSVSNSLVGGAGLLGVGIVSNSSMRPNDLGYTPVFSGIASSDARVTLTQNGSTVYSEMVPPGPFEISNANLLSSGDVTMTITEKNGTVRTQFFPLTIVPNMLNPGEAEYSVYAGLRDSGINGDLEGVFTAGSLGYGFSDYTLRGSALLHANYAASGIGLVRGLGEWGTLGLEGAYSHAKYEDYTTRSGGKFSLTYAKTFNKSTSLQLIGAQYTSKNYVEFSEFSPWETNEIEWSKHKTQYQLSLSHQVNEKISTGLSAWHRIYWGNTNTSTGANINMSTRFDYFSFSLGGNYSKTGEKEGYGASLSVSIPFDVFEKKFSSYGSVNVTDAGSQSYTAGISSSIGDDIDYSTSVGWSNSSDDKSYSLQSSYRGDRALLNSQVSKMGENVTGSASISGSAIVLPTQRDVIFTRNISDTIAIANVKDVEGVKFMSSPYPTNDKGNAVIPLSSYRTNSVTLEGATLPIDVELLTTNQEVVPTAGAVVYMPFKSVKVKRYLFQVREKNGKFIPNGTWAVSSTGAPLGFITQNGVLFVNSVDELNGLNLGKCVIKGTSIKDTHKLQEVMCED